MSSKTRLNAIMGGADPLDVWNQRSDPAYKVRALGDVAKGKGVAVRAGAMTLTAQKMLDGLVGLANSGGDDLLRAVFDNDKSFAKHVQKRMARGEIASERDYAERTFSVLANATSMTIVEPKNTRMLPTGKMQLTDGSWIVLLGERGNVVTSHPFLDDMVQFEQRHKDLGDKVYEQEISETYREALKRLFDPR